MGTVRRRWLWIGWIAGSLIAAVVLGGLMFYGGSMRAMFLIGRTTNAHHQIELACKSCHTSLFGGEEALQKGCLSCHKEELKAANDSHPISKFRDPRNADRLKDLNAVLCVTCHREHQPDITGEMAVTLPIDYCAACHEDIGKERATHAGLGFETCASAGCHNFHDNRALYKDFLIKHVNAPAVAVSPQIKLVNWTPEYPADRVAPLRKEDADAPGDRLANVQAVEDWLASAHAANGVNCSGCHTAKGDATRAWIEKPGRSACASCHKTEALTFTEGKHGMRFHPKLDMGDTDPLGLLEPMTFAAMTPAEARLPMKASAHDTELGCNTCHGAHKYDRRSAAVESCATCHDDTHTRNYFNSSHYSLWQAETSGAKPKGSGVSCATCHMPLTVSEDPYGEEERYVMHNQNENLRPNERMVRSVCLDCHGLEFTLDALADREAITSNFSARPATHVQSLDWIRRILSERQSSSSIPTESK